MDDVDRIVGLARASVQELLARARERMAAGGDARRIHATYVVLAMEMLEDVELYAVLASAGDREALAAIDRIDK